MQRTLENPAKVFRFRTEDEAKADKAPDFPAYTFYASSISFTPMFATFGPEAQAAMVLHEAVHFVDAASTPTNDYYEHGPAYPTLTTDQHVHNPSSYASFAGHVTAGSDVRYGAGRRDD